MSCDAKAWKDGSWWKGLHDGECGNESDKATHEQGSLELSETLAAIERCSAAKYDWSIRAYPKDEFGLVGYQW